MWSRQLSAAMGINQEDFVKAFISALSEEKVVKKLENVICERLIREVHELRDVIKERDVKIKDLEKEITSLKETVDQQEQYSRRNNLRITGIEENETEDVVKVTLDFINNKVVNESQQVTVDDIDRVHRVGRKQGTASRPILVRFATYRARQRVYANRLRLNPRQRHGVPGRTWGEVATTTEASNMPTPSTAQAIYINEDLTKTRATLLWQARQAKLGKKIRDCWSTDGNILLRDLKNTVRPVKNINHLNDIISESG